jgi:hypothetical protein
MLKVAQSPGGSKHAFDPMEMQVDSMGTIGWTLCQKQRVATTDKRLGGYTGLCAVPVDLDIDRVTCPRCRKVVRERSGD